MAVKRLIIMRHGYCGDDALTPSGEREVLLTAKILREYNIIPDHIITSPTGRSRESTILLCRHFNKAATSEREMYTSLTKNTHAQAVKDLIATLPEEAETVLFSGHGETVHAFGYNLLDEASISALLCAMGENEKDKAHALLHVATADALVLRAENGGWVPEGYITDKFIPTPPVALIGTKDWRRERLPLILLYKN